MHPPTHRGHGADFWETSLQVCFFLPGLKFFLGIYNFPDTNAITITTPAYAQTINPSASLLFTLGNNFDILLYHTRNPRGISAGTSYCPLKKTDMQQVTPTTHLMQHAKGRYRLSANTRPSSPLFPEVMESFFVKLAILVKYNSYVIIVADVVTCYLASACYWKKI